MPRTKNPTYFDNAISPITEVPCVVHDTSSDEEEVEEEHRVSDEQEQIGSEEEEEQIGSKEKEETGSDKDKDLEEGTKPLQPLQMYFGPTEYKKPIKIATKCFIKKAVETIESRLNSYERRWFIKHPQFRHFFHMEKDRNHKVMGVWMLLLRTTCTEKKREAWFFMNGVPIRYSLRELM